jgi:hypothetical protein
MVPGTKHLGWCLRCFWVRWFYCVTKESLLRFLWLPCSSIDWGSAWFEERTTKYRAFALGLFFFSMGMDMAGKGESRAWRGSKHKQTGHGWRCKG